MDGAEEDHLELPVDDPDLDRRPMWRVGTE